MKIYFDYLPGFSITNVKSNQFLSPSVKRQTPHLPLLYLKILRRSCTTESLPWFLITLILLVLVWIVDSCIRRIILICLVANIQIKTTSKCWTITWIMTNCLIFICQMKLISICQRKQKWSHWLIFNINTILIVGPFDGSVTSNFFAELGLHKSQSVRNTITFLMKFC